MVLDEILPSWFAKKHPIVLLAASFVLASAGIWIALYTFPSSASVLSLAFLTIAFMPLIHRIIVEEEMEDRFAPESSASFFQRHWDVIKVYAFLFIGLIVAYSFWYAVMPPEMQSKVFLEQNRTVDRIHGLREEMELPSSGAATGLASGCGENAFCWFELIFFNNAFVLFLAVVFSFVWGAGAVFLLSWNASVLATVIGRDVMEKIGGYAFLGPTGFAVAYGHGLYNALGFLPHGLPEIMAYFIGAIAGGIISVAVSKRMRKKRELQTVFADAGMMIAVAVGLLFAAAWIEAYLIAMG